jgi:hypothetical protein
MAVFGEDSLQKVEIQCDAPPFFGEQRRVVGRPPQFVGCWEKDDVGRRHVELMLAHTVIYPMYFSALPVLEVIQQRFRRSAPQWNADEISPIARQTIAERAAGSELPAT